LAKVLGPIAFFFPFFYVVL